MRMLYLPQILLLIFLLLPFTLLEAGGVSEAPVSAAVLKGPWSFHVQSRLDEGPVFPPADTVELELPQPRFMLPESELRVYWLRIAIPSGLLESYDRPSLYLGKLPDHTRVFINGRLMLESGSGPPDSYYGNPFYSHGIILPSIDAEQGEKLQLDLRIYSQKEFANLGSMYVDSWPLVSKQARLESLINLGQGLGVSVISLLTFMYFLLIFLMEPQRHGRGFLAMSALGFAINASILYVQGGVVPYLMMYKLQTAGLHIGVLGLVLFLQEFLEVHQKSQLRSLLLAATLAAIVSVSLSGSIALAMKINDTIIYPLFTAPMMLYFLALALYGVWNRLESRWLVLTGVSIVIITGLRDLILTVQGIVPRIYLNLIGLATLMVIIFLAYAANFVKARRTIARQAEELQASIQALELREKQLLNNERLALVGSLVAGVHHEVRTPLGNALLLSSFLEDETAIITRTLKDNTLSLSAMERYLETSGEGLNQIRESIDRADKLLDNFRKNARDQIVEEKRCLNLDSYLTQVVESLSPRFRQTPIELILDLNAPVPVSAYPGALWQIVSNLMLNSLMHAFPNDSQGKVLIHCRQEEHTVLIVVEDNGAGMDPATRDRAFETFFTTRASEGGTGLGLTIVRNLVEDNLGGTITLESSPGTGSRFVIRFPLIACGE